MCGRKNISNKLDNLFNERGGNNRLKKLNLKLLNLATWITLILVYVLPFKYVDGFETQMGFLFLFISIYDVALGSSPLNSMGVSIGHRMLNITLIYLALYYVSKLKRHRGGKQGIK